MLNIILFVFVLYYLLSVFYFEGLNDRDNKIFFALSCTLVAIVIGVRDPLAWSDSSVYYQEFIENVKPFSEMDSTDGPVNYGEMGFYYLGVIAKTISNSGTFYFVFVSVLAMLVLYLAIRRYSIFPFIALYVYLGRFVGRNTVQIRGALAIAIVIWGTVYVTKRQLWKYILVVFVASRFHTSAYLALPLYFLNYVKIQRWHVYVSIILSLIIAQYFGEIIRDVVSTSDIANEWARSYVEEDSEKAWSNDLTNPVIWYQIVILFWWTWNERILLRYTEHYYTIRNAYLYSTIILIVLCQYAILAGRSSTIFATYEVIMIPLALVQTKGRVRTLLYVGIFIFYFLSFYITVRKYLY